MREVIITMSAQFRMIFVMAPKNRGKLKWSNGFRDVFLVVFCSFPRRKITANVKAIIDPII